MVFLPDGEDKTVPPFLKSNVHHLQDKLKSKLDTLEQFHYQNTVKELKEAGVARVIEQQDIRVEINPESTELLSEEREG